MLSQYFSSILLALGGCHCGGDREPAPPPFAIEVRDESGIASRVFLSRPCRAIVEGVELLVGGPPLVAQNGAVRWSADEAPNGTTFRKDGVAVARFHARQLFDAEGLPILRVLEDGRIADRASAIIRRAEPAATGVTIRPPTRPDAPVPLGITVNGTSDVVLAALLTAPEIAPDLRGILACHRLLTEAR